MTRTAGMMHTSPTGKERNTYANPTYRGWSLLVAWKDGSTNWVKLKDIVNSTNPVETAEYALNNKLNQEPAFSWWSSFVYRRETELYPSR
jgi:hypothetical protein